MYDKLVSDSQLVHPGLQHSRPERDQFRASEQGDEYLGSVDMCGQVVVVIIGMGSLYLDGQQDCRRCVGSMGKSGRE